MSPAPPTVIKVGGSILRDAASYREIARQVADRIRGGAPTWVVVSAARGVTDALLGLAEHRSDVAAARGLVRHYGDLLGEPGDVRLATALSVALTAPASAGSAPIVAWGEFASALVVQGLLARLGVELPVRELGAEGGVGAREEAIVPGFYTRSADGGVTLLSRGGSDLSAVLVARRVGADAVRLWKEGGGIRLDGRPIAQILASELILRVRDPVRPVHVGAVGLAALWGIDLYFEDPLHHGPGTRVAPEPPPPRPVPDPSPASLLAEHPGPA